jgi:hypothetical protein
MHMDVARKWLWDRADLTLAVLVLASFVFGWIAAQVAMILGILALALAVIVVVKEVQRGKG